MAEELPVTRPTGFPTGPPGGGTNLDVEPRPSFAYRDVMQSGLGGELAAKLGLN